MNQYQSFKAFVYRGKEYLALTYKGGQKCLIVQSPMLNCGTWYDVESFKKFIEKNGENDIILGEF